jgi:prepilin-type N-terminal cleavage/methylation domain-containing protein
MRTNKTGFTLVELLVVISIIALLLSVLMPALSKARDQAKKIVCGNILRQTGISMASYAGNNKGKYPTAVNEGAWPFGVMLNEGVLAGPAKLLNDGYLPDPTFFFCPAAGKGQFTRNEFLKLQNLVGSNYSKTRSIKDISWIGVYIGYDYWIGYRTNPASPAYQDTLAKSVARDATDRGSNGWGFPSGPGWPKISIVRYLGVAVKAKKLILGCWPRASIVRMTASSLSGRPSSSARIRACSFTPAPANTPFISIAPSPPCELWASSIMTA